MNLNNIQWDYYNNLLIELAQKLIQINSSPPNTEKEIAHYISQFFFENKIEPLLLGKSPQRPNVLVRIKGRGELPPILISGHLDTVPFDSSQWSIPPLSGQIKDGFIWGRGALDMKSQVAMMMTALKIIKDYEVDLSRDIIAAFVVDEEQGFEYGSKYLVEEHPSLIKAEYGLGEVGGFNINLGGKRVYLIQTGERGVLWLKIDFKGEGGHGSLIIRDSVIKKIAKFILSLDHDQAQLTPELTVALKYIIRTLPLWQSALLEILIDKGKLVELLLRILPTKYIDDILPMVTNTYNVTVINAGAQPNVIPEKGTLTLDIRYLPGTSKERLINKIKEFLPPSDIKLEEITHSPPYRNPIDSDIYQVMERSLIKHDPEGIVIPYLMPGATDGKIFAKLGIKWYGFLPVKFENISIPPQKLFHNVDERIPVEGLKWGLKTFTDFLIQWCSGVK